MTDGSATDSSDEHDRHDHSEDEDDAFFDTYSVISNGSDHMRSGHESKPEEEVIPNGNCDAKSPVGSIGFNYPHVKRRKELPEPVEKDNGVSLWSIIKDNIGKDLTKVCLPVYFNEPLSSLQKCCEDLEYSYLLDQAYEWGKMVSFYLQNICS